MGGKRNENKWAGFERIPNYKGKGRDGSKCLQCNKTFTSATYDFFDSHRIVCQRRMEQAAKSQASKTHTLSDDMSESSFNDFDSSSQNDLSFSSTTRTSSSQNRDSMENESHSLNAPKKLFRQAPEWIMLLPY